MTGTGHRSAVAAPFVLLLSAALVAGCGVMPFRAPIRQAHVGADDPARLELELGTCNAELTTDVVESADEVVVTVTARHDTMDDCADLAVVHLDAPLGDRVVIDGARGEPVPVGRPG